MKLNPAPKTKHVVFLDFDGVMTSVKNGTSFLCCNTENYHIDNENKECIEQLKEWFPDLKIVLSTAWCNRGALDDPTPNWPWKGHDMKTPLPSLHKWLVEKGMFYGTVSTKRKDENGDHITKYEKIRQWIEEHEAELDDDVRLLVLDDDASDFNDLRRIDDMKLDKGHISFLQINYETGFSEYDLCRSYERLSKD